MLRTVMAFRAQITPCLLGLVILVSGCSQPDAGGPSAAEKAPDVGAVVDWLTDYYAAHPAAEFTVEVHAVESQARITLTLDPKLQLKGAEHREFVTERVCPPEKADVWRLPGAEITADFAHQDHKPIHCGSASDELTSDGFESGSVDGWKVVTDREKVTEKE